MATTKNRSASAAKKETHTEMLPPPLPQKKILESEVIALGNCFRNAVVKTGQVYSFYADGRRLGIDNNTLNPPRSLTTSLGREVEKFDQLCDAIESRLLRATSVLRRDLVRAEERLKAAEAAEAQQPKPPSPLAETLPSSPVQPVKSIEPSPAQSTSTLAARRPSTISLSSLHRPSFPHKLDLSSLRLNPEDIISLSTGGLASPVTLAPKSARQTVSTEIPPDLMAALSSEATASSTAADIDLTLDSDPVDESLNQNHQTNQPLGNSADKPIELDLDIDMTDMQEMSSIFGTDATNSAGVEGLFSPADTDASKSKDGENIEQQILDAFSSVESTTDAGNNIFASIDTQQLSAGDISNDDAGPPSISIAPSPGSLLASLNGSSGATNSASTTSIPGAESPFDINSIDLTSIDQTFLMDSGSEMNLMEQLFNVDGNQSGAAEDNGDD